MYFAVYLQSKPETVHQRIKNRKVNGEEDIPLVRIQFINSNDFFLSSTYKLFLIESIKVLRRLFWLN